MPRILIIYNSYEQIVNLNFFLQNLENWQINYFYSNEEYSQNFHGYFKDNEIHFLLFSKILNQRSFMELKTFRNNYPLLQILYFGPELKHREFAKLYDIGINFCVIGENRHANIIVSLEHLWANHWRRIPSYILNKERSCLSARAKKILEFIENKPISYMNISSLSSFLQISESHFRYEFKNQLGINFRNFKKQLITYYEEKLLIEEGLKPSLVFEVLDYNNISGFSRSFKRRHGISWRNFSQLLKNN